MTHAKRQRSVDLELSIGPHDGPVEIRALATAAEALSGLVNDVAESVAEKSKPVRWFCELKAGSVRLPLRGEPVDPEVAASVSSDAGSAVAAGLELLERGPVRPPHFTDKALERARSLGKLWRNDFPLSVQNGRGRIELSSSLALNAAKALGGPIESFGTVEGQLDSITIHDQTNEAGIWQLDGKRVKCLFGEFVKLEEVMKAMGRRVAARGEIESKPDGEHISVLLHSLRVIGDKPASVDEVRGIFKAYQVSGL